jgi:hypothetical protein
MRNRKLFLTILALGMATALVGAVAEGSATTVTGPTITFQFATAALSIVESVPTTNLACPLGAGVIVASLSTLGGDGNAVTFALSGDTTDFAISGSNIVTGTAGVPISKCGTSVTVTPSASQP